MTLLVTPYSKLLFRIYDRSAFKKDSLIGEHTLDLFTVLKRNGGRLDNTALSLDLKKNPSSSDQHTVGEMVIALEGMQIDLSAIPTVSPPVGLSVLPANSSGFEPDPAVAAVAADLPAASASSSNHSDNNTRRRSPLMNGMREASSGKKSAPKLPPLPKENGGYRRASSDSHNITNSGQGTRLDITLFSLPS